MPEGRTSAKASKPHVRDDAADINLRTRGSLLSFWSADFFAVLSLSAAGTISADCRLSSLSLFSSLSPSLSVSQHCATRRRDCTVSNRFKFPKLLDELDLGATVLAVPIDDADIAMPEGRSSALAAEPRLCAAKLSSSLGAMTLRFSSV
jgi:hypothetical protein